MCARFSGTRTYKRAGTRSRARASRASAEKRARDAGLTLQEGSIDVPTGVEISGGKYYSKSRARRPSAQRITQLQPSFISTTQIKEPTIIKVRESEREKVPTGFAVRQGTRTDITPQATVKEFTGTRTVTTAYGADYVPQYRTASLEDYTRRKLIDGGEIQPSTVSEGKAPKFTQRITSSAIGTVPGVALATADFGIGVADVITYPLRHPIQTAKGLINLPGTVADFSEFLIEFKARPTPRGAGEIVGMAIAPKIYAGAGRAVKKPIAKLAKYDPRSPYYVEELPGGFEQHKGSFQQWALRYKGDPLARGGKTWGIRRVEKFNWKRPEAYVSLIERAKGKKVGQIRKFDPIGQDILLRDTPSQFATPRIEAGATGKVSFIGSASPDISYIKVGTPRDVLLGGGQKLETIKGRAGAGGTELGQFYSLPTTKKIAGFPKGTPQVYTYYAGVGKSYGLADLFRGDVSLSLLPKKGGIIIGQEFVQKAPKGKQSYRPLARELGYEPGKTQPSASTLTGRRTELEAVQTARTLKLPKKQLTDIKFPTGDFLRVLEEKTLPFKKGTYIKAQQNLILDLTQRKAQIQTLFTDRPSLKPLGERIISKEAEVIAQLEARITKAQKTPYTQFPGASKTTTIPADSLKARPKIYKEKPLTVQKYSTGEQALLNEAYSSSVKKPSVSVSKVSVDVAGVSAPPGYIRSEIEDATFSEAGYYLVDTKTGSKTKIVSKRTLESIPNYLGFKSSDVQASKFSYGGMKTSFPYSYSQKYDMDYSVRVSPSIESPSDISGGASYTSKVSLGGGGSYGGGSTSLPSTSTPPSTTSGGSSPYTPSGSLRMPSIGGPTTPPPNIYFKPEEDEKRKKKRKKRKRKTGRKYGYSPSLSAQVLSIETAKLPTQKFFTGAEIRPVIRRR